jgi:hypothetical protein
MITFKGTSSQFGGPIKFSALVYDSLTIFQYCIVESMTPCFEFRNPPGNPGEAACPLIDHCIIRASGYSNTYVTGGASPTFSNCFFNNAASGVFVHGAGNKMKVLNCVISNCSGGIINGSMSPWDTNPGHNLTVDHVTFYNCDGIRKLSGVTMAAGCGITSVNAPAYLTVTNCVFDSLASAGLYDYNYYDPNYPGQYWHITTDYNCFYKCTGGPVYNDDFLPGTHSIEADPRLIDPVHQDFTYPSSSPCWGTGTSGSNRGFQPTGWSAIDDLFFNLRQAPAPALVTSANPTAGAVSFAFRSAAIATVKIYSQTGHLVWASHAGQSQEAITWSGRDQHGRPVATGVYYAVAGDGKQTVRQPVVVAW